MKKHLYLKMVLPALISARVSAPDCVFKEYCTCLDIWNSLSAEGMLMPDSEDDALPF